MGSGTTLDDLFNLDTSEMTDEVVEQIYDMLRSTRETFYLEETTAKKEGRTRRKKATMPEGKMKEITLDDLDLGGPK